MQTTIQSKNDLDLMASFGRNSLQPTDTRILVGAASCGLAAGANAVIKALEETNTRLGKKIEIKQTGCIGFCQVEPLVDVWVPGKFRVIYQLVNPQKAVKIMEATAEGRVLPEYALMKLNGEYDVYNDKTLDYAFSNGVPGLDKVRPLEDIPFYKKQYKIVLRNCGFMEPTRLDQYIARGGYYSLYKALTEMKPDEIVDIITKSGLRGRGGGGFVTGRKWRFARDAQGDRKFVICNADEGDPGAYMDRSVLEGDPHTVIEGMIIGAYAIGDCHEGFVYVRNEYPIAIDRLKKARDEAREAGLLGDDIFGTGFAFDLKINRGGGAFVCGESTALMASLEGFVGEPRAKYIHTVEHGLYNLPTVLNNVETWANIPVIINRGADWFSGMGTKTSKGTKVFSLVGNVKNTGLVEVPMGITLREILFEIGEGVPGKKKFKAVQTGGPSGGTLIVDTTVDVPHSTSKEEERKVTFVKESLIDLPVDFEALTDAGSMMGSGGMIVMDQDTCMVDVARFFLDFLKEESCGKCVPCREGIRQMLLVLEGVCRGEGKEGDVELLEELSKVIMDTSLCALGGSAPNPVLSTIRYFRDEYITHIRDKRCPAGVCKALVHYSIDAKACNGCHACFSICPTGAITGTVKQPHLLDESKCIKCKACYEACKFDAVLRR